jgi:hopanoid biosynthesis associated RND transporter like protein HpnN
MQRKILDYIYNLSLKHGKLLLVTMAVLTVIFGAFIPRLIISSSQQNLIPENDPEQARYIKFNKEFGSSDYLIVVLDGDSDACKAYADDFAHEIEKEQKWVKSIFYKIDTSVLLKRAPLFASVDDLNKGYSILQKNREMLKRIQNISGLYGLLNEITENFKKPNTEINVESATQIITFLNTFFAEWNDWIVNTNQNKLKIVEKLTQSGFSQMAMLESEGYLFSRDFKMMFLFIQPKDYNDEITYLRPFMSDMRKACDRALKKHPELQDKVKVAFTGMPAHVLNQTEIIYSDVGHAGIASVVIVALILLIGFRSIKKTIVGVIPTVSGMIISLGILTLLFGKLNLISSSFLAVLFGIGIDFSIYLLQRTEEELGNGLSQNEAIYKSVVLTSRSIISGGLTTSFAFLALALSKFQGYSQLGWAAGIGLLVVMFTTFFMMPALLMNIPVEPRNYHIKEAITGTVSLERKKIHLVLIGVGVIITVASIIAMTRLKMEYNVLKMLPTKIESSIYQHRMEEESDYKMSFAMITDKDLAHLKEITDKVKLLPTVSKVESLADVIPPEQEKKIKIIRKFKPLLGNFRIEYRENDHTGADYISVLDRMSAYFEDAQEKAFAGSQTKLVKQIDLVMKNIGEIKEKLASDKNGAALARTGKFEKELFANLEKGARMIRESLNPAVITEASVPKEIINRFKSDQGTYVAMVSPAGSIWDVDFLDKFVSGLKKITPDVTGFPVTHRVYVRQAASAIFQAMMLSFIVILILLIIDFRGIRGVLLSLLPLFMGMMLLQLMLFILKIDYDVANIAGLPLLLGLGVVYGLRIVHRWREDTSITAFAATQTTGRGLAFAALAIIAGLVSIIFARHNGVSSFGKILLIGIITCMFTALIILPAIIDFLYVMKNKEALATASTVPVAASRQAQRKGAKPKAKAGARPKATQKKKRVSSVKKKK